MKSKLLMPALLLFITANFYSCKKDTQKSKTDLLTQSSWKIVKTEADPGTGIYENEPIDDCQKDDAIKLNADHTYATSVGVKCDPSDENETGAWSLSPDEKTLTVDSDPATIETLDDNSLVVMTSDVFGGVTYRYRVTFSH